MEVQPQSSKVVVAVPDPNAALEGGRQSVPFRTQAHTVVAATRVPVVSAQHGYTSDVPDSNAAGDGGRHAAPFSTKAHVETAATRIPDDSAQHGHSSVRFSDALDVVPDSNELDFTEVSSSQFHDSLQQRFSVHGWYEKVKEKLKEEDEVDKVHARQLRKEKRMKEKMKWKRGRSEEDEEEPSESDGEAADMGGSNKKSNIYFDTDSDGEEQVKRSKVDVNTDAISLEEQEALALKLLDSTYR
ncbi:hypothetical protein Ancab_019651 [Ancistrocladus abbreviatus]